MTAQLPLALRFPPDQRFETFISHDPGLLAQLRALATGSAQAFFIAGGPGAGKTHLALALCAHADSAGLNAVYLSAASAAGRFDEALQALHEADVVALDGLDAIAGHRDDELALFAFHNRIHDAGRSALYTARSWPDTLDIGLPDLRSRLAQCTRIALPLLDDAGRVAVLRQRAASRGLVFDDAALDWLMRRYSRDLSDLGELFERLDRASLAAQRRLTVPFLREVIGSAADAD